MFSDYNMSHTCKKDQTMKSYIRKKKNGPQNDQWGGCVYVSER